jgi:acyl-CoA thioester hydrolase
MEAPFEVGWLDGRRPPFKFSVRTRVSFSDTDAQGVVYYGRYMPYFDQARLEYQRYLTGGAQLAEVAMRALSVEYHAPARFDDLLETFVRVIRVGRTSITYELASYRYPDGVLMATATQTEVRLTLPERTPTPISDELRRVVTDFEGEDLGA